LVNVTPKVGLQARKTTYARIITMLMLILMIM